MNVPGYISLLGEKRFDEALQLHRERNPLAARACPVNRLGKRVPQVFDTPELAHPHGRCTTVLRHVDHRLQGAPSCHI